MAVEFAKISAKSLGLMPRDKTVFFFPVGPMEDHGPHLPLGLDLSEAEKLCQLAADRLEKEMPGWAAVLMPSAPLGIESNTTVLALTVRPHVLRDWLVDACRGLKRAGFSRFVCISGHPGPRQLTAIEEAGKIVARSGIVWRMLGSVRLFPALSRQRPILISASSALVAGSDVFKSLFWPNPPEHGGKRDTSVALALSPGGVDPVFKGLVKQPREESFLTRGWLRARRKMKGYWGNPSEASGEEGEKILHDVVKALFPKIRAFLDGANPSFIFRSWFSVLPHNKSFFKAWLLAFALLAVLLGWFYLLGARLLLAG